jgi:hypothetical protein
VWVGVVEGGVGNGAPICVYCVVNPCLVEQRAFPRDVLWGAKGCATGASECFGGVCRSEALGVGPSECVVNRQLECGGGGSTGVEGAFCFLAPFIFLHVNCG